MDWSIFIATGALVLSLVLTCLEIIRHRRPLIIRCIDIQHHVSAETSDIYLIRVALVNQASVGRTVFALGFGKAEQYQPSLVSGERDPTTGRVRFSSHGICNGGVELQYSDTFVLPLDIFPHQSENRWFVLDISPKPLCTPGSAAIRFPVVAYDVNGKELAQAEIVLSPKIS